MKALTLTIQAFGPFAKTQKIDFSLFGESSLYLINGNTGSGKTTILDAISFALYGDTTGKEREASDMRCDYADASLPTEVIFEFKLGEKIYRIQRMPKQEVKKSRGEGTTTKAAEANLWEVNTDGEESLIVPRKVSDVTKKVIELMGLNSEQFRQVMVLPQGRFRELLLADSKDREDIFSQLFQTQIYKQVEEDIKAQAKSVKERIEAYHIKMSGILETVDLSSEEAVEENILSLAPEHQTHQVQKITAADAHRLAIEENQGAEGLQQQFETLKIQQETLTQHQLQQPHIDSLAIAMQRAMSADKIRSVFEAMQGLKQDKTSLETTAQTIT
ncbi:MAG: SMC family ATPase, partial [Thiomicrorhabdus sp.]|nr:SMC family ATPase [Thiomicrorhabdus sp.]